MRVKTLIPHLMILAVLLAACAPAPPAAPGPLVVASWAGYMPQSALDAFTEETGIPVQFVPYADQDEALEWMREGKPLDVVVLGDTYIPLAVDEGLLAPLDFQNIPNFRNLGPNFRDLIFDPDNLYSVMIQWGTTGLVVRTDRVYAPVTSWADLWDPAYAGKIGVWPYKNELIGIALKTLGHSINSEDPDELAAAGDKLVQLRANVYLLDPNQATGVAQLLDDRTVMIYGWSYDAVAAHKQIAASQYILPEEGTLIWTDNVTIPAATRHKIQAEQFINFLLRPTISAQFVNELSVPSPNEAARPYVKPDVAYNTAVYPPRRTLEQAEFSAILSPATLRLHDQIWERFLAASGPVWEP